MKSASLTLLISLIIISQVRGQSQPSSADTSGGNKYKNEIYKFSVNVPDDWKLYGQVKDDQVKHRAIVDWGLPAVYSDIEKTDIENSVSITAYKRSDVQSVDELISFEKSRVDPASNKMVVDSTSTNAVIIRRTAGGLEYKGKSYFVYKNGIGYVINFMATPGTYTKNLAVFERFYKNLKFE